MAETIKELVRVVLEECPGAAHDVRQLLFNVWQRQGFELSVTQRAILDELAQPETIRRASRKILNEGE